MATETMTPCTPAARGTIERPRFYPRQVITATDLTLEQEYFREKMRRHNRLLHGWGVVCGAQVACSNQKWKVVVKAGYILGPYGDEIAIPGDVCFDLRCRGEGPEEKADPCGEIVIEPPEASEVYVAVRYRERKSRPVQVSPAGCGCEDNGCEYSRLVDEYEICTLDTCTPHDPPSIEDLIKGPSPGCPSCPPDPWVILAKLKVKGDGTVDQIDNKTCRRQVMSFARFWWQPADEVATCTPTDAGTDEYR